MGVVDREHDPTRRIVGFGWNGIGGSGSCKRFGERTGGTVDVKRLDR